MLREPEFERDPAVCSKSIRSVADNVLRVVPAMLAISAGTLAAQVPKIDATAVQDHLHKAESYLKANDQDDAKRELEAVLAIDPNSAEAYSNLGVIAFSRHDCQTASQRFRKALEIQPSLTKTEALLGICAKRVGDPAARALLEKSFSTLKDKQLRLEAGLELARLYDEQGDAGGTASVMRTLVNLDPDNVDVLFMAQRVYTELADDTLNKLALLAPGSARMQQVIAERLVNEGDLKRAIDHYQKALQIDPRVPGVHFELGEAMLESSPGDTNAEAQALKEFESAIAVDGDSAKTECQFANIALLHSQPEKALAHFQRALEIDPNEVQAQMGLAKLLTKDKPQEAIKYLRMAVKADPLNGSAHYRLGQIYRRLEMNEMAEKEMHLFEEIKRAKDQMEALYHEMNRQVNGEDQVIDQGEPVKQ